MSSWLNSNYSDVAKAIEAIATTLALGLGGLWTWLLFVRHRQRYPRAKVSHEVQHRRLVSGGILLHITVTLENNGDVLLGAVGYLLRVQQVLPLHDKVKPVAQPNSTLPTNRTEIPWPSLAERRIAWARGQFEIEPGETDRIYCDVVVPDHIETVEVYSYFDNAAKHKRRVGWTITTLHDL